VADSPLAGQAALDGPDWASRMVMFRVYYPDSRHMKMRAFSRLS